MVQLCQMNFYEGQFYPFAMETRFQYAPFNMFSHGYPSEFQFQDFQYFVVIDFEATCYKAKKNPHPQEIIELPSVIVSSATGQLEACFETYVRPTCNQLLSDFCKDLTGIQQIQVDRGVTLNKALLRHDKWLEKEGIKNTNFAVVTLSNWDCRVMCNQKEAVKMAGLAWQGRAHCGLDDAKNNALLLALLMRRVKNSKGMVRKPGPKQGSLFFGCGNRTATRGALCHYFEWAST
ncbi:hypothetical protein GH714_031153 [Hevea brasiliensis]|uniref:Exonuclease domain-containing protein n=1 Tax=Hevea brasiliensis TaxID=3981 RepID=A0A6A6LE12_HEVBR|nr:hypothetical protein GH714_031153 [Hevea brasiliensis]